jgi:hypothetical protein
MLDWLGRRHRSPEVQRGGELIERAVAAVLAEGKHLPVDQGGSATTRAVGEAVALAAAQVVAK